MTEYYIIMTFTLQNHYNAQSTIMYKMITVYYIPPNDGNVLYVQDSNTHDLYLTILDIT